MKHLSLSLKEKIGQLLMIGFEGESLSDNLIRFIETYHIGSFILFSRNIRSIPQVIELTETIHSLGKVPPLIYTDQEGGTIVRFDEMAATVVSPMGITATGNPGYAESAGRIIGEDMRLCGIDGVFAPVLDVNIEEDNPVIGIRSFSDQPGVVVEYAGKFLQGLRSSGVLGCGKHYPGHGAARADSHLEIPIIPLSQQNFREYCFQPFEAMAQQSIDAIMTGHVLFPEITPDIATFSPYLVQELLREKTGYQGVVFSDCLEMKAIIDHYSTEDIVLKAVRAGIDVLVPSHTLALQEEMLDILLFYAKRGTIEEKRIDESLSRILAMKNQSFPGLIFTNPSQKHAKKANLTPDDFTNSDAPSLIGWDRQPPAEKEVQPRKYIHLEQEIADHSITVLRNSLGVLPVEKDKSTLIVEWTRKITGPSVAEKENRSVIGPISAHYLENRSLLLLNPGEPLPDQIEEQVKHYAYVIVFIYSRTGKIDHFQTEGVKKLLSLRKDVIIVALENPYEIKKFPFVDTYLLTYGYRRVQVEALFKVLTGEIPATGNLPVKIAGTTIE